MGATEQTTCVRLCPSQSSRRLPLREPGRALPYPRAPAEAERDVLARSLDDGLVPAALPEGRLTGVNPGA